MSYFNCTAAYASTGVKTITVGFQPANIRVTVSQKYTGAQTYLHLSVGAGGLVDVAGTPTMRQHVDSLFHDSTSAQTVSSDSKVISFHDRVSGTLTEIIAASIDSFTATELKLNFTSVNVNYNLFIEVWS